MTVKTRQAPHNVCNPLLLTLSILLILPGCAGVGYNDLMIPLEGAGWKHYSESRIHEFSVKYECDNYTVKVNDILVGGRLLGIGILVPVIPVFVSVGGYELVKIDLLVSGDHNEPEKDSLIVITENNDRIRPDNLSRIQAGYFQYVFPLKTGGLEGFELAFLDPFTDCKLPPVQFKAKTVIRGGISNMGP